MASSPLLPLVLLALLLQLALFTPASVLASGGGGEKRTCTRGPAWQVELPRQRALSSVPAVVGGTGGFRMARNFSLLKVASTSPEAAVFQLDRPVRLHGSWSSIIATLSTPNYVTL